MQELQTPFSSHAADSLHVEKAVPAHVCAPLVGSSVSALYKLAKAGAVPCLRVGPKGRGVRFVPSAVRLSLQARPAWELNKAG